MASKTRDQLEKELYERQAAGYAGSFRPTDGTFYNTDNNKTLMDRAVEKLPLNSFNEPDSIGDGRETIDYKAKPVIYSNLVPPRNDFNDLASINDVPFSASNKTNSSPQNTAYDVSKPQPDQPLTRLQQLAKDKGTVSKEFLRAAYLGVYPEDETPNNLVKDNNGYIHVGEKETNLSPKEQASLDVAMLMDRKQNSLQQRAASPQSVEVIGNGGVTRQVFDGGGNSRVYDRAGNELSRSDQEQMRLMGQVQGLIDLATPVYSISNPNPEAQAAAALHAIGGLKATPTISDTQKDAATTRHLNVTSDLAPDLAQSTIGYQGANAKHQLASIPLLEAQARKALAESKYSGDETQAKINEMNAHADALRRGKLTKDDYSIERAAIKAATSQGMDGNPIFKPEIYDAVVSHARGISRVERPKTRAEAIDAYQKKWGKKYTVEQYNKMADRDGF